MSSDYAKLKIKQKLGLIFTITLTGLIVTLTMFYQGLKSGLVEEKKIHAEVMSEAGLELIKHYYALSQSSDDTTQYKQNVLNALQSMSFGEQGYYWVNDSEGLVVMHPIASDLVGTHILDYQDKEGTFVFREIIAKAKAGGGIVQYYGRKPGADKDDEYRKMSYVTYFEPWD